MFVIWRLAWRNEYMKFMHNGNLNLVLPGPNRARQIDVLYTPAVLVMTGRRLQVKQAFVFVLDCS